jgi:hemophore-related protein
MATTPRSQPSSRGRSSRLALAAYSAAAVVLAKNLHDGLGARRFLAPIVKHRGTIVGTTRYALQPDPRWWGLDADSYDPTRFYDNGRAQRLESAQSVKEPQMTKLSLTRLAVAVGGLALSLTAGAGVASADPDLGPIVNTTCTYSQAVSALNAQDPAAAAEFNASPPTQSALRRFIASPPDQRLRMAQQMENTPGAEGYFGVIQEIVSTCNNY